MTLLPYVWDEWDDYNQSILEGDVENSDTTTARPIVALTCEDRLRFSLALDAYQRYGKSLDLPLPPFEELTPTMQAAWVSAIQPIAEREAWREFVPTRDGYRITQTIEQAQDPAVPCRQEHRVFVEVWDVRGLRIASGYRDPFGRIELTVGLARYGGVQVTVRSVENVSTVLADLMAGGAYDQVVRAPFVAKAGEQPF